MFDFIARHPTLFKWTGITAGLLALAGFSFGLGRYLTPPREVVKIQQVDVVRTVDKIQYVDRVVVRRVAAKTTRVEERPDGTRVTETSERTSGTDSRTQAGETIRAAESAHVLEAAREVKSLPDWRLGAYGGFDGRSRGALLGGSLDHRLVGPLSVGVFLQGVPSAGPESMAGGITIGLEF